MPDDQTPTTNRRQAGPPPRLKDRYRLLEWLGEGSMGMVYRAHDEALGRDVAIKFLLPEQIIGGEASARFLREARLVARLSHPNIMTLHDMGREGTWHYLVLEYIAGQDLHTRLVEHGGPLPVAEALRASRGLLEALAYAHEQGVIHRDIKPENMLVTPDGRVKVADFGLSVARGEVRLTRDDVIVGTVLYLAPEVISGARPDARADLYACGAVLYELLTGRPPFWGDNPATTFSQILNAPLTPPRALEPGIPAAVEQVILTLLARNPADRFESAAAALAALPHPDDLDAAPLPPAPDASPASSLLERLVRSSQTARRPEEPPPPQTPSPSLPESLLLYAALEDTAAAVEAERRRLAGLLQEQILEQLNLLLAQAGAYGQTLGTNPAAGMALSVITTLARQIRQQVKDLEANLRPTVLETLGLEPALEALANQTMRAHGLQITLSLQRMAHRPPPQVELALFRAAQDALERAVRHAHASQVTVQLQQQDEQLIFSLTDNSTAPAGRASGLLRPARQRIEQLGGTFQTAPAAPSGFRVTVRFPIEPPVELTPREMDVIQLLVEGLSNKEIARSLSISPRTVNFHLDNIYSKLNLNSRTEAAVYALRHGWLRRPV